MALTGADGSQGIGGRVPQPPVSTPWPSRLPPSAPRGAAWCRGPWDAFTDAADGRAPGNGGTLEAERSPACSCSSGRAPVPKPSLPSGSSRSAAEDARLREGYARLLAGDLPEAGALLAGGSSDGGGGSPKGWMALAAARVHSGQPKEALQVLRAALSKVRPLPKLLPSQPLATAAPLPFLPFPLGPEETSLSPEAFPTCLGICQALPSTDANLKWLEASILIASELGQTPGPDPQQRSPTRTAAATALPLSSQLGPQQCGGGAAAAAGL